MESKHEVQVATLVYGRVPLWLNLPGGTVYNRELYNTETRSSSIRRGWYVIGSMRATFQRRCSSFSDCI